MTERFVYVTYIRTTPEKLWEALVKPEFTKLYWAGCWQESDWAAGSDWRIYLPDGRVGDQGKVVEIDPPRRLVLSWRNEFMPELKAEGWSRCSYDIELTKGVVKFTVTHEIDYEDSKFIQAVSNGWPAILSALKSLLETGETLENMSKWRD